MATEDAGGQATNDGVPHLAFDLEQWGRDHPAEKPAKAKASPTPRATQEGGSRPDRITRARMYVDKIPGAVSGQKGHDKTFDVACSVIKGFNLSVDEARPILLDYNARCDPPWAPHEIEHKLEDADKKPDQVERGYLYQADRPDRGNAAGSNGHVYGEGRATVVGLMGGDAAGPSPDDEAANEAVNDPHRLARVILNDYLTPDGIRRIAYFRDDFYIHDRVAYRLAHDFRAVVVVNRIKKELDEQNRRAIAVWATMPAESRGQKPQVPKVTWSLVRDVAMALGAMVNVDRDLVPPFWIGPDAPEPESSSSETRISCLRSVRVPCSAT